MRVIVNPHSMVFHKPIDDHPENPGRISRILRALESSGIQYEYTSDEQINVGEALSIARRIHTREYLELLEKLARRPYELIDEDTYITRNSLKLALETFYHSYIFSQELKGPEVVFYISRPPGHHAGRSGRALGAPSNGFCLLNNAASAILSMLDRGLKRVLAIDFDAHHGNGTMEIFYDKPILQIDIHQHPRTLYPFSGYPEEIGLGEGAGYKLNVPLYPHSGDDFIAEISANIVELIKAYNPEGVVVSAGFDGYANDGLSDLSLSEFSYYLFGKIIRDLGAPTTIVLEGGYSVGLSRGVIAFIRGLKGEKYDIAPTKTPPRVFHMNWRDFMKGYEVVKKRIGEEV